MLLKEKLQRNKQAILEIASQHGAFNIRVFASVARGEDTEDSDSEDYLQLIP